MSPGQHFIISWVAANVVHLDRRSRIAITLAGLAPDLDGFGWVVDRVARLMGYSTSMFEDYHHMLHNLLSALVVAAICGWVCGKRWLVFWLALLAFHLHLLADLVGSRGPDGYQWPIPYLEPFTDAMRWTWTGQWELSDWRNPAVGVLFFIIAVVLARHRRVTFFEPFSKRFEATVVEAGDRRGFFRTPS
jgi:LexA-binding, inner membrane-associated putative hydrolase